MNFGLRALLLVAATILFVVAAVGDSHYGDLIAWGLACLAGALLIGETGFARIGKPKSGPCRDRTCDLGIKSPLLYQLS